MDNFTTTLRLLTCIVLLLTCIISLLTCILPTCIINIYILKKILVIGFKPADYLPFLLYIILFLTLCIIEILKKSKKKGSPKAPNFSYPLLALSQIFICLLISVIERLMIVFAPVARCYGVHAINVFTIYFFIFITNSTYQ